ncbi:hypothetical protein HanLR1_Chr16g0608791 [Helianthus annuus]|nr:hypothetical protein HanLR1_Chr16g0608791 [Helianthus annuus]
MTTIPKGADEKLWYHRILKNFALPRDEDLAAQPSSGADELINLGIGPEKKKRVPVVTAAPKAQVSKGERNGTCRFSKSWCDYIVVSDTLEGLAPVALRKPKAEPRDTTDILVSNPDDPMNLESSQEPLLRTKAVKRKPEGEAAAQPVKKIIRKKINKKGNLDALAAKLSPESSSVFNDDLPRSPPRVTIKDQLEGTKVTEAEAEKAVEVKKPIEVKAEMVMEAETADVDAAKPKSPEVVAREPEKGKSIQKDPVITIPVSATTSAPVNVEKSPAGDQGFFAHDEEDSPIHPEETLGDYYYRSYSDKRASDIHAPIWKLKQGDTFSDWQICRDWLQGVFPPAEVKFQEERSHDQTYHAYLKETPSSTSTTHRIVRKWCSMHKEWAAFEASKNEANEEKAKVALLRAKLEANQAKFESEQKTEEWSTAGWKRKAESDAALLSEELKRCREIS